MLRPLSFDQEPKKETVALYSGFILYPSQSEMLVVCSSPLEVFPPVLWMLYDMISINAIQKNLAP